MSSSSDSLDGLELTECTALYTLEPTMGVEIRATLRDTPYAHESTTSYPSTRYARIAAIKQWLPEIDPNSASARTCSVRMAARPTMLIVQAVCAGVMSASVLGMLIWSTRKYARIGDTGTFFTGSCLTASRWDTVSHGILNALSTLFLGAGNYTMQVLVAPSRGEVDKAHKKGRALDIGIHSASNVRWIAWNRRIIWGLLGVVAVILHLCLNSALYRSIPLRLYPIAIVTSDFQNATDNWKVSNDYPQRNRAWEGWASSIYSLRSDSHNFSRIGIEECITIYSEPQTVTSALVLVSAQTTAKGTSSDGQNTTSSLLHGFVTGSISNDWENSSRWVCNSEDFKFCTLDRTLVNGKWSVYGYNIQYCLIGPQGNNKELCGFHYSWSIFIVVLVCMSIGSFLIAVVAYISRLQRDMRDKQTMVTLGDALAEYLKRPDECTMLAAPRLPDRGLFSKVEFARWDPVRPRWFRAVNAGTFLLTILLIALTLVGATCLFVSGLNLLRWRKMGIGLPDIWSYGLGRVNTYMLIYDLRFLEVNNSAMSLIENTLIVNSPQVIVSFLYLLYNNCITCQLVVVEWSQYMGNTERKSLRVSAHTGAQRSTYMLSLPKRYAVPLLAASTFVHFLVSRSIFIVQTKTYTWGPNETAKRIPERDMCRIGFSSLPILLVTITGVVMLLFLVAMSVVKYPLMPAYLPKMATKSAFISAACQRPDGDEDAYLFPLKFMVVEGRRITFSTDCASQSPRGDGLYQQPMPIGSWDDWKKLGVAYQSTIKLIKGEKWYKGRGKSR